MVDIKLLIEVNPNESSEFIDNINTGNREVSNTSIGTDTNGNFNSIPNKPTDGSNGLTWAYDYLVFNENDELDNVENSNGYLESEENPMQFFWGIVPEDQYYNVKLTIEGAGALKDIVIYGDKISNQFPTEAIINGTEVIYSDDPTWVINFGTEKGIQTIEFTKWNRANYNATITAISVLSQFIEIRNSNIKEFNSKTQIHDGENISYDVIPSQGDFTIIDVDGEIKDAIQSKTITDSNLAFKLYINNNLVRQHTTESSSYDTFGNLFEMSATDSFDQIGSKEIIGATYPYSQSLFVFVGTLLEKFGYSYEDVVNAFSHSMFYDNDEVYGTIKSFMEKTIIPYPSFDKATLRDILTQLCQVLQLGARLNVNNKLEFFSLRPKVNSDTQIIPIPLKNQFSVPSASLFPVDVYKKVIIQGTVTEQTTSAENYSGTKIYNVGNGTYYKKTDIEYTKGDTNSNKVFELSSNIFMDSTIVFYGKNGKNSLINVFGDNLLGDHTEGTKYVSLKVSLSDYFDINGQLVISSENGQVFDVGDIVRIDRNNEGTSRFINADGSPICWSVVSSEIVKVGVPFINLVLRQVSLLAISTNKVGKPYSVTKPSLTTNVEYTINTSTEGAKIIQYTDNTYSTIANVFNDGDVFFAKGMSVVSVTMYFKAIKDGMQDSDPFVFQFNDGTGSGDDILQPL